MVTGRTLSLQGLFLLAFALGTLAIGLSEWLPLPDGLARLFGTAVPIAIMFGYLLLAQRVTRTSTTNSIEQVADSLYFLGFMFTLVALLSALMGLAAVETATIVSRFGFALCTTLAGLLGKVVLTQFVADSTQKRRHVEQSLAEAATRFRRSLETSSMQLEGYVAAVHARMESGTDSMLEAIGTATRAHVDALETASHAHLDALHEVTLTHIDTFDQAARTTTAQIEARHQAFVDQALEQERRLGAASEALLEESRRRHDRLAERGAAIVDDTERRAKALGASLDTLSEELEGVTRRQRDFSGTLLEGRRTALRQLRENSRLMTTLDTVQGLCEKALSTLQRLEAARDEHVDRLSDLATTVGTGIGDGIDRLETAQAANDERLLAQSGAIGARVEDSVAQLGATLASRAGAIDERLGALEERLQEHARDTPPRQSDPTASNAPVRSIDAPQASNDATARSEGGKRRRLW